MLLEYFNAESLLRRYGIRSVGSKYVSSWKEAASFSRGKPVVLKVLSEKQLHKSKAGLVRLGLDGEKEIRDAYEELSHKARNLRPYKIIAQVMAETGIEAIIGGKEDQQFGKMVLIGLGGIYVEAFKDFAMRACPITRYDAVEMLSQLRSVDIITYKGKATTMITELLIKASRLLQDNPGIKELDLNPVVLREDSYDIVDIRVLI